MHVVNSVGFAMGGSTLVHHRNYISSEVEGVYVGIIWLFFVIIQFYFNLILNFETEGRHVNAKAHEVVYHLASFFSSKEEISQSGMEPPISSLRFGYVSTIM